MWGGRVGAWGRGVESGLVAADRHQSEMDGLWVAEVEAGHRRRLTVCAGQGPDCHTTGGCIELTTSPRSHQIRKLC